MLKKSHKNFLWISIVVFVIGIFLGFIIFTFKHISNAAVSGYEKIKISEITEGIKKFYSDCRVLPKHLKDLINTYPGCASSGTSPYMKQVPKDYINRNFIYIVDGNFYYITTEDKKQKWDSRKFKETGNGWTN